MTEQQSRLPIGQNGRRNLHAMMPNRCASTF